MIRSFLATMAILSLSFSFTQAQFDEKSKEVVLTGTLVCAKCGLKTPGVKKCTNALQVKEGGKTVTYFLDDEGSKAAYHEGLCGGDTKEGAKVTGVVSVKDGQRMIKPSKVEEKK
jgi:hypothetical protein